MEIKNNMIIFLKIIGSNDVIGKLVGENEDDYILENPMHMQVKPISPTEMGLIFFPVIPGVRKNKLHFKKHSAITMTDKIDSSMLEEYRKSICEQLIEKLPVKMDRKLLLEVKH